MIYCISCEKYPREKDNTQGGGVFSSNTYKVRLISSYTPSPMPTSGIDVMFLSDNTIFAIGSRLYINGSNGCETYIYNGEEFVLWYEEYTETPDDDNTSDLVGIGEVDYMILTS